MSLSPQPLEPVPEDTSRVARAAFPKGNPYVTLRDQLGMIFQDEDFTALFPLCGQPGRPPWRIALVTILQFRETLADRQAAEAVRACIDWKYLLGLELSDPSFDCSVLSEFCGRLLAGSAEELLFAKLLDRCRAMGLLAARGQQLTASTHVLAAIRLLNRTVWSVRGSCPRMWTCHLAKFGCLPEHVTRGMPSYIHARRRLPGSSRHATTSVTPGRPEADRLQRRAHLAAHAL